MSETAAHLIDHVIPREPIRQWALSLPFQLRYWLSTNPKLQRSVLDIIIRIIAAITDKPIIRKILRHLNLGPDPPPIAPPRPMDDPYLDFSQEASIDTYV